MDFWIWLIAGVALVIDIAFAVYAGSVAEEKGYSKGNWIAICLFFGIIGYVLVAALPDMEARATLTSIHAMLSKSESRAIMAPLPDSASRKKTSPPDFSALDREFERLHKRKEEKQ